MAAGSIVVTTADIGAGIAKYSVAWTSDGSGNVNGTTFPVKRGRLLQVKFIPGSGGTQPTDQYAATVIDPDGADILIGDGAALSNASAKYDAPVLKQAILVEAGSYEPRISAAGNAKTGTITLLVGPG